MPKLRDVNTTSLTDAIALGCETMQRIFNPADDHRPHFDARAWPADQVGFGYQCPYTEAHVPGRHLLALLTAQHLLGVSVDEEAIRRHRAAAFYSFSGALPVPLNRERIGGPLNQFADHNLREGLFALYALVRYRNDAHAQELAERCIAAVLDHWRADTGWDLAKLESLGLRLTRRTFIWGPARSIGPLARYHAITGSAKALELAMILAEKATNEFFRDDGAFDSDRFGRHTHSSTCTLSSLAQLGESLGDARLLERVRAFYDHGLSRFRDELGWVLELADLPDANPDRGEINNTGDIVETAMILGRHGHARCFADAERMLRGHLLPAQLRDTSFIAEPSGVDLPDGKRDAAARMRGAFGFPAPYGHHPIGMNVIDFCLDIVGGGVHSLCEAWRQAVTRDAAGTRVHLLFDRDHDGVRVESPYTHDCLRITTRHATPLWVRVPSWVDRTALRVEAGGAAWRFIGEYAMFPATPVNRAIAFRFGLAEQSLTLRHRTRDIAVRLRGDAVAAMQNHGADLTFFDPL